MKKLISLVLSLVIVLSLSSCMKVNITLPEKELGVDSGASENTTAKPQETVTLPEITTSPAENTTAAPENTTAAPVQKTPLTMSKAELLEWFNLSLNNVKEGMPGFKRAKQTTVADISLSNQLANTLVSFVKGMLLSEEVEEKTATKGQSCVEIMSPDGERYVSQLSMADVKDISVMAQGTGYAVTVTLPDAENPTKDEGAYAKIFNFITVDDVMNTYAPKVGATVARNNVKVTYSGCTAKAVISPDGKIESYNTYVTCVVSLKDATVKKGVTINTDVDFTLVSTTDYTNFAY
ncbi:MAG: hypothetical protein J6A97_02805 [Clostridia bacterium]|nr:hypothetical protein [Clostridia bacterium]